MAIVMYVCSAPMLQEALPMPYLIRRHVVRHMNFTGMLTGCLLIQPHDHGKDVPVKCLSLQVFLLVFANG